MRRITLTFGILLAVFAAACVTINVYFPEAAAVDAADRIIRNIQGDDAGDGARLYEPGDSAEDAPVLLAFARGVAGLLIADAHAQAGADFDKPSPEKQALEASMRDRYQLLKPYFESGAIGYTESGLVEFRDRNLVPLRDRNNVVQLVAAQNNDANALYQEIARLNGHPEWVDDIRRTFGERWAAQAASGHYYREGGVWKQR